MPIAALTNFPAYFVAGDTVRLTISDANYPSSTWTLKVLFSGATNKSFDAAAAAENQFELVLTSAQTATLAAGLYSVSYVYTETATSERITGDEIRFVSVFPDPTATLTASTAQEILDALEASLKIVAGSPDATVSFNGQSFTQQNLKELQDAIVRQKQIVNFELNQRRTQLGQPSNRFSKLRFG